MSVAPADGLSPSERLSILVGFLFGAAVPSVHHFQAGDVLIAEGESLRRPALLVIEGEVEECIGSYSQDAGPGEHTVHVARTGDLADVQAIVEPYCNEPAQCSVHAMTDGACYPLWRAQVARRPELDAVLSVLHEGFSEAIERQRALAVESEELAARLHQLGGDGAHPQRMSVSEVLDEWEDTDREELKTKLEQLREDLERQRVSTWQAQERQQELQRALDLERRARAALEQRAVELMKQLAGQANPEDESDEKFPSAIRILESTELEEMESEAKRHRDLAENYVNRARLLHKAFERIASDNPGIIIKPDVMQLMLGEEPTEEDLAASDRPQSDPAAQSARRNTMPFELGSDRPPQDPVQIPRSARVPDVAEALSSDDLVELNDAPEPPGTRRSR
jgi:hypothetical protein